MEILEQVGHQGDTQWFLIDGIPQGAKKIAKAFVAASEQSGSVHVLCGDYDMYEAEGKSILHVKSPCVLNHTFRTNLADNAIDRPVELPTKDRRSSVIPAGIYFAGIQRRYDPFSKMMRRW